MNEDREVGIEEAMTGLGAAGAGAGIIAGQNARTANRAMLKRAQDLYAQYLDGIRQDTPEGQREIQSLMKQIYEETGWYRGPDGQWKFEIPEIGATYKFPFKTKDVGDALAHGPMASVRDEIYSHMPLDITARGKLSDFVDFPSLSEAYPGIEKLAVHQKEMPGHLAGRFSARMHTDLPVGIEYASSHNPIGAAGTLTHELQHAIQGLEGFGQGGAPEGMKSLFPEENITDPYQAYRSLGGEVEARTVQERVMRALYGGQPYGTPPFLSESNMEIPPSQQLIYDLPVEGVESLPRGSFLKTAGQRPPIARTALNVPETAATDIGRSLMQLLKRAL